MWYSLIGAGPDSPFQLPNSTVGRVIIIRPLDAEEVTLYPSVIVRASDNATEGSRRYTDATFAVAVEDVNDNSPR